jgi:hypothetical protein
MSDKPNPDSPLQGASQDGGPQQCESTASRLDLANALDELIVGRAPAAAPGSPDAEGQSVKRLEPGPGRCPQPAAWSLLMSGEAQPFEADELLAHATGNGNWQSGWLQRGTGRPMKAAGRYRHSIYGVESPWPRPCCWRWAPSLPGA